MKRQVQETGIRRWFGDDYISLQNELYTAFEGFLEPYGNMIVKGCDITLNTDTWVLGEGLVGLYSTLADEYRICRVAETELDIAVTTVYLVLTSELTTREYKSGGAKNVVKEYKASIETAMPSSGEYLTINQAGGNRAYREALQSASYRFVTDTEKSTWNSASSSAITTIRGGVATAYNTLLKLYTWASGAIDDAIDTAATDATTKADAALASAKTDATTKANAAITTAASDATTKADAAESAAIATAATDATTKANAAISTAATDATTKADAAESSAISTVRGSVATAYNTLLKLYNWAVEQFALYPKMASDETIEGTWNFSGNVGVGTASPTRKFHVQDGSAYVVNGAYILAGDATDLLGSESNPFLYRISGGSLGLSTSGVNRIFIASSSGFVGVGTTSPSALMEIKGSSASMLKLTSSLPNDCAIQFDSSLGSYKIGASVGRSDDSFVIYDIGNGAARLTILSSGNVGVGKSNPLETLDVAGHIAMGTSSASVLKMNRNGINYINAGNGGAYGAFMIQTGGGVNRLYVDSSGNVGIGTTAPTEKLEVAGNIKASGSVEAANLAPKVLHLRVDYSGNIYSQNGNIDDVAINSNIDGAITEVTHEDLSGYNVYYNAVAITSGDSAVFANIGDTGDDFVNVETYDADGNTATASYFDLTITAYPQ